MKWSCKLLHVKNAAYSFEADVIVNYAKRVLSQDSCVKLAVTPEMIKVGRITHFFYLLLLKRRRKIIENYFSGAVFHAEYDYANRYTDRFASKSLISMQNHDQIYRVKSIF